MRLNYRIKTVLEFIRFELCLFASFIGMTSYLLFNQLSIEVIFVIVSSFFVCASVYAYNNTCDMEEDLINRGKINPFAVNKGLLIVGCCILIGLISSLLLSTISLSFFISSIITGIIYSSFKLKKHFLIKNLYTSLGGVQLFLIGANVLNADIVPYCLLFSFFIFIGSLISDLRDYEGDKFSGIKTLPVVLGYQRAKIIVYLLLVVFPFFILQLGVYSFIPLITFSLIILFFLIKNKPKIAHMFNGISFIFLTFWLILI